MSLSNVMMAVFSCNIFIL